MTELQNSFDNGTDGELITVANSAGSGDPFESTFVAYYDIAGGFAGGMGARLPGDAAFAYYDPTVPTSVFLRTFVWMPTPVDIFNIDFNPGTISGICALDVVEAILYLNIVGEPSQQFVTALPFDAWFRVELAVIDTDVEGRLFLEPDSVTPVETLVGTTTNTMVELFVDWGNPNLAAETVYFDQLGVRTADWWGPFSAGDDPPSGGGRRKIRRPRNPRRYQ